MTTLQVLKEMIVNARGLLESTMADLQLEHVHKDPGGMAFPVGATYAHLIFSEDAIVNGMMAGKQPLFAGEWKDKTGASSPMPPMDEKWEKANMEWSKSVQIDLAKIREYAKAVYAATDAYLATLTDADVEREIDLGAWGKKKMAEMLYGFVAGHTYSLAGEVSALKGVAGVKGYPF